MNDHDNLSDETASAYIDHELSASEQRDAEADIDVMARVAVFTAVRAQVRSAPSSAPDPARRDAAIAAALGAADGVVVALHPVVGAPARRPSHRQRWAIALSGAAAAGLLAVAGLAALGGGGSTGTQAGGRVESASTSALAAREADTAGDTTSAGAPTAAEDNAATETSPPGSPAVSAPPIAVHSDTVGSADTPDELRRLLVAKSAPEAGVTTERAAATCPGSPGAQVALVTWQGQPAVVVRTDVAWVVLSVTGCQVLAEVPLT
jgi:hypothetical protein